MKKYLLTIILCACLFASYAQQDPLYSQFISNPVTLNPAMAGYNKNLSANINYRHQWNGLDGSPRTFNANGDVALLANRVGAGLIIVSDVIGATTVTETYAVGAYRVSLAKGKILSFGLRAGVTNYSLGGSKANVFDSSDPYFQGTVKQVKPGIGTGVVLQTPKLMVGLSIPELLRETTKTDGNNITLYNQHFYLMGAYMFTLSPKVKFRPSTLIKGVKGAPMSVDLNAAVLIQNRYQAGLLVRNLNTFGMFGRVLIREQFSVGYVYEIPTRRSVGSQYSTFEIMLGLRMRVLGLHTIKTEGW